ncbi:hypothetical protein EDB80DRAFT_198146 [Ilyonectria destructans]|nr:hypothetical protein EDB80DRAFT_198146 [Ilyonectria destructans]
MLEQPENETREKSGERYPVRTPNPARLCPSGHWPPVTTNNKSHKSPVVSSVINHQSPVVSPPSSVARRARVLIPSDLALALGAAVSASPSCHCHCHCHLSGRPTTFHPFTSVHPRFAAGSLIPIPHSHSPNPAAVPVPSLTPTPIAVYVSCPLSTCHCPIPHSLNTKTQPSTQASQSPAKQGHKGKTVCWWWHRQPRPAWPRSFRRHRLYSEPYIPLGWVTRKKGQRKKRIEYSEMPKTNWPKPTN